MSCVNLTNRFHVAVCLFSSRSQMTSKCGKNKEVAHEPQASVSVMFLMGCFFCDVFCDLSIYWTDPRQHGTICFIQWSEKKKDRYTYLPRTAVSSFFISQTLLFVLLVYSFFENFCNVFSCSKQNSGEKILQNSESRSDDTMATVVKISCRLGILKL